MSLINMAKREINCKIVYYGIGLCGKTTNLHYIHQAVNPQDVGDMVSIDTETERTLYFDLLPLELGKVHGFNIRFQLYTVPGQVLYQQTRISVLKGADCVIFVSDSQASKLQENIASWNGVSLSEHGRWYSPCLQLHVTPGEPVHCSVRAFLLDIFH